MEFELTYWQYYLLEAGKIILYWELFKYVGKGLCKYTAKIWRIDRILREHKESN